jgi:3-oxoacyl-[acyl-carrier protein] reductase
MTTIEYAAERPRVVFVTGGASGIGLATARAFAADGARVAVADIDVNRAARAAEELAASGSEARPVACDVTDEQSVRAALADVAAAWGGIDVLVNNAGFTRDASLGRMSVQDFTSVLAVHVQGAWLCTREVVAHMKDRAGERAIVNMSSISGKVGNFGQTNYSAAKAALVGLTKASAKELARHGIRVNAVQPGLIATPMTEQMSAEVLQQRLADIPLQRIGLPEEVASVVTFLAGPGAAYVTGATLEVTGGRHM